MGREKSAVSMENALPSGFNAPIYIDPSIGTVRKARNMTIEKRTEDIRNTIFNLDRVIF